MSAAVPLPEAMIASQSAAPRPEVLVEVVFDRGLVYLALRNIGTRPALHVVVDFGQKLLGLGGARDVGAQALFRDLAFLGPDREIATLLDAASSWFARGQPTKLTARVRYADANGGRYEETIQHDLGIYRDIAYVPAQSASD